MKIMQKINLGPFNLTRSKETLIAVSHFGNLSCGLQVKELNKLLIDLLHLHHPKARFTNHGKGGEGVFPVSLMFSSSSLNRPITVVAMSNPPKCFSI